MNIHSLRSHGGTQGVARAVLVFLALGLPVAVAAAASSETLDAKITLATQALDATRGSADPARYALADQRLAELRALTPDAPQLPALQAWQQMGRHLFREALALAEAALSVKPADPLALALRADALTELGRYDEAVDAVEVLLDRSSEVIGFPRAAQLRFIHGDLAGATELTARALGRTRPGSANARWLSRELARLESLAGHTRGALALLATLANPDAEDHATQARVLMAAGQTDAAQVAWQQAFDAVPQAEYALPLWKLARTHGQHRDAGRLGRLLDASARLDRDGLSNRAFIEYFGLSGRPDEALRLARAELLRRPDIYGHAQLAWALGLAGQDGEAGREAALALRTGSQDPELWRWLKNPAETEPFQ